MSASYLPKCFGRSPQTCASFFQRPFHFSHSPLWTNSRSVRTAPCWTGPIACNFGRLYLQHYRIKAQQAWLLAIPRVSHSRSICRVAQLASKLVLITQRKANPLLRVKEDWYALRPPINSTLHRWSRSAQSSRHLGEAFCSIRTP